MSPGRTRTRAGRGRGCIRACRVGERGAAVFIVVLVITMLMAIGVFAARSARLTTTASGHARQMTQIHYLTEYGMQTAVAALSLNPAAYVNRMLEKPDSTCFGMAGAVGATCLRLYQRSIEDQVIPGGKLIEPPAGEIPGSLGRKSVDAPFTIDLSSYYAGRSVPGYDGSPDSQAAFCFGSVAMTGTSRIRVTGDPSWAGAESARAYLTVGPLPCH